MVEPEDLSALPDELRSRFWKTYRRVLAIDPYQTLPNHGLSGDLAGYQALEIAWAGIDYRLVYRVYDSPAPRRVLIISFDEHDPAYDKARARTQGS